jgi:hypothetical protein
MKMPANLCAMTLIEDMAKDMEILVSLGIEEEQLAETHPTPEQTKDLLKGLLYLRELHPQFYNES